jgi:CDP-diacylglycerol---serine O-phosphatidyltransferase
VTDRWRVGANLATLANGLLGLGAILYTLAGNPLWAMLLIACAIGFDGLDGLLSRRSPAPPGSFGRVADSVADAVSFGLAPAVLIAVHPASSVAWGPWEPLLFALAAAYFVSAICRLTYFTAKAYELPYFRGVPTPESALAVIVVLLFHDVPAFQTVEPFAVLTGVAIVGLMMVVPVPYPKVRRGSPFRPVAVATGVLAGLALVPLQFRPAPGSALFEFAEIASFGLLVGVACYYLLGPFFAKKVRPDPG